MNTPTKTDELFQVELRIAQRADELARQHGTDPVHALDHWRQAEREIWKDSSQLTVSLRSGPRRFRV